MPKQSIRPVLQMTPSSMQVGKSAMPVLLKLSGGCHQSLRAQLCYGEKHEQTIIEEEWSLWHE